MKPVLETTKKVSVLYKRSMLYSIREVMGMKI